jgi:outer membrane lipoprotein
MDIKLLILLASVLLTACASTPEFDTTQVDRSLTPQSVIAEQQISLNKIALWGGTVLDTKNLKDSTQIEVLAYPLNTYERPQLDKQPLGRFIILHQGYLEPATYSQGRLVTVKGLISDIQEGKVGESMYSYPVISSQQLHLWSKDSSSRNRTSFHIGVGIGM